MVAVLVLEDSPDASLPLRLFLTQNGCRVSSAGMFDDGGALFSRHRPDVILLHLNSIHPERRAAVNKVLKASNGIPLVVMADAPHEYLGEGLEHVLPKDLAHETVLLKVRSMAGCNGGPAHEGIVGKSPALRGVLEQARMAAQTNHNVLITGESGTGKELFARYVHRHSQRAERPLVTVNCAALGETLFHAEMFGYRKGAFTGADATRSGYLHEAEGGSLFLDEIGEIPLHSQVILLRVLERGEYNPVGDPQPRQTDVRFITATNRDIAREVQAGHFRLDLFYRLNVFHLALPPLRARVEDIPLIAAHFLHLHCAKVGAQVEGMAPAVLDRLMGYAWPGNARELENIIIRAIAHCQGPTLTLEDISFFPAQTDGASDEDANYQKRSDAMEREKLFNALSEVAGDVKKAANLLRLNRATLYRKIKNFQIDLKQFRSQRKLF